MGGWRGCDLTRIRRRPGYGRAQDDRSHHCRGNCRHRGGGGGRRRRTRRRALPTAGRRIPAEGGTCHGDSGPGVARRRRHGSRVTDDWGGGADGRREADGGDGEREHSGDKRRSRAGQRRGRCDCKSRLRWLQRTQRYLLSARDGGSSRRFRCLAFRRFMLRFGRLLCRHGFRWDIW